MSDTINIVHETYIDNKQIDESTLPANIQSEISSFDDLSDQYLTEYNKQDSDDAKLEELSGRLSTWSQSIKDKIVKWEVEKNETPKEEPKKEQVIKTPDATSESTSVGAEQPKVETPPVETPSVASTSETKTDTTEVTKETPKEEGVISQEKTEEKSSQAKLLFFLHYTKFI